MSSASLLCGSCSVLPVGTARVGLLPRVCITCTSVHMYLQRLRHLTLHTQDERHVLWPLAAVGGFAVIEGHAGKHCLIGAQRCSVGLQYMGSMDMLLLARLAL